MNTDADAPHGEDAPGSGAQETGATAGKERSGIVVVGAGTTGLGVARRIANVVSVTVIDKGDLKGLPDEFPNIRFIKGDATSLLVLREARIDDAHALVAATASDDVNIEACRLAAELRVPEVICRLRDPDRPVEATAVGAKAVTSASAMISALMTRLPSVVVTTSEVGLGQGDILQVRVMRGSPVVGNSIRDVATREYLVAAIYREGELVVPHGDTVIEADDQVLLVGRPDTLRAVASYFRLGGAQFPRQFGRAVIIWSTDEAVHEEARWLREATKAPELLQVVEPGGGSGTSEPWPVALLGKGTGGDGRASPEALEEVLGSSPGIFVLPPARQGLFREKGMGPLRSLVDTSRSPLLIARGTQPYRRILVAVGDSASSWRGLELAVDIARLLDASITAVHVTPPSFVGGSRAREVAEQVSGRVAELGRLFDVPLSCRMVEGNPVREVEKLAQEHELLVVARTRGQTDTYLAPDVGLRMVIAVRCSAILLTWA